jgi:TonB family protein
MHRAQARCAALLAAFAASAGCATPRGAEMDRSVLLSDAPRTPTHRDCRVAFDPPVLPAADALVDSARLAADSRALWDAAGRPSGYVLLSMRYAADGTNVRRAVLESSVPAPLADTLQQRIFESVRTAGETDGEWGVRLRVDLGDAPRMRVGRREDCAPFTRERLMLTRTGSVEWSRESDPWQVRTARGSLVLRVQLDAGGFVTGARLERGVHAAGLEQRVVNVARGMRFEPATEDGYPVPSETIIRIQPAY